MPLNSPGAAPCEFPRSATAMGQPFGLGISPRISLNSVGPFRSRRFRCCRSAGVVDELASLSICWPAITEAFDADFGLRCLFDHDPASPNSTRRRIASDWDGLSGCSAAHLSTFARSSGASRTPMTGERRVAGLPRFFRRRSRINQPFFATLTRDEMPLQRWRTLLLQRCGTRRPEVPPWRTLTGQSLKSQ